MHESLRPPRSDNEAAWIAFAEQVEPIELPKRRASPSSTKQARCALTLALLGLVCFGFVFGALALTFGRRAVVAAVMSQRDASTAHAAMTLGKAAFAVHLAVATTIAPWLLFMLPRLRG